MDVLIRPVEERDFPRIVGLFREFAEFENLPGSMVNTLDRLQEEKEYFQCFVAETSDGDIIGYATWFFGYFTWSGKALYMDDLYIRPAWRGRGIGTRLIREVIRLAKASGCHKMRWQVADWNHSAIRFYDALGALRDPLNRNCDLDL